MIEFAFQTFLFTTIIVLALHFSLFNKLEKHINKKFLSWNFFLVIFLFSSLFIFLGVLAPSFINDSSIITFLSLKFYLWDWSSNLYSLLRYKKKVIEEDTIFLLEVVFIRLLSLGGLVAYSQFILEARYEYGLGLFIWPPGLFIAACVTSAYVIITALISSKKERGK